MTDQAPSTEFERPARAEHGHWGPPTRFGVDRQTPKLTFDTIEGTRIIHGQVITIHWPEMEEARHVDIDTTVDSHGTEHNRAYFEVAHFGAYVKIYLRDVQHVASIQLNKRSLR